MKKTLLSILAMLLVGISGAWAETTTIGDESNTSAWWKAFSDYYTIKQGQKAQISFKNYSDKAENFHNWILAVTTDADRNVTADGYEEYLILRADNAGWGSYFTDSGLSSAYNWDTFKDDMDGSTVTMDITFDYGRINVTSTITTASGTVYPYSCKTICVPVKDQYRFFFTTELGHMTDFHATVADYNSPVKAVSTASETLIGSEDNSTEWWKVFSNYYTVKNNQMAVVKFKNYSAQGNNWDNWTFIAHTTGTERGASNYSEYMALRADGYGWNGTLNTNDNWSDLCKTLANNFNWDTFKADNNEADVELRIWPMGESVIMQETLTNSSGTTYYQNFVSTAKTGMSDFTYFLAPQSSHQTDFTVTTYGVPYNVTYHNNNHGTAPEAIVTDYLPNPLPTMTEEGWAFDGWFTDEALTTAAVAGANITADTNLYAKWSENNNWSVDFTAMTGTDKDAVTVSEEVSGSGMGTATLKDGTALNSNLGLATNGSWIWRAKANTKTYNALQNSASGARNLGVFNAKADQYVILNSSFTPTTVKNAELKVVDGNNHVYKVTEAGTVTFSIPNGYNYVYSIEVSDEYYTFSVTGKSGDTTIPVTAGYAKKGTSVTKYWSKYVKAEDGVWYAVDGTEFGATFTESTEKEVTCTASTVSQFFETSDMTLSSTYNKTTDNVAYSGGNYIGLGTNTAKTAYGSMATKTAIPAGTYDISVYAVQRRANTDGLNILTSTDGSTWSEAAVGTIAISAATGLYTTATPITFAEPTYVKFVIDAAANQNHFVDYVTFAPVYSYSVKINVAGTTTDITSGSAGAGKEIYWSKYQKVGDKWYSVPSTYMTVSATEAENAIELTATAENIVDFIEAENMTLSRSYGNYSGNNASAGAAMAVFAGANLATTTTIAAGTYYFGYYGTVRRSGQDDFTFQTSTNGTDWTDAGTITMTDNEAGLYFTGDAVTLSSDSYVRIVEKNSKNTLHYVDYMVIQIEKPTPSAITNVNAAADNAAANGKYIKAGKLVIIKNGAEYSATGARIK